METASAQDAIVELLHGYCRAEHNKDGVMLARKVRVGTKSGKRVALTGREFLWPPHSLIAVGSLHDGTK